MLKSKINQPSSIFTWDVHDSLARSDMTISLKRFDPIEEPHLEGSVRNGYKFYALRGLGVPE
jgi:hypothetical protein